MNTDTNPTREAVNAIGNVLIALLKGKNQKTADFLEAKIIAMNASPVEKEEDDLFSTVLGIAVPPPLPKTQIDPNRIDEGGVGAFAPRKNTMDKCPHTTPRDEGDHFKCPLCGEIAEMLPGGGWNY